MAPRLGSWGPLVFESYGTFLVLSGPVALAVLAVLLRRRRRDLGPSVDLATLALLAYGPGARLLNLLLGGEPHGSWGGQIAFAALAGAYLLASRAPFGDTSDALAVAWAALTVPVKIGCFLAGCCHGAPTGLPWAATFPGGSHARLPGIPVHPTQLYDAGAALVISLVLGAACWRGAARGRLLLVFGLLYALAKLASESVRGDLRFRLGDVLPASMAVEIAVAATCLAALVFDGPWRRLGARGADEGPPATAGRRAGVFAADLAVFAAAVATAVVLGAGVDWPSRALVAYLAVHAAGQLILRRPVGRGLVQALAGFTGLALLRPLFDRRARAVGDAILGPSSAAGGTLPQGE